MARGAIGGDRPSRTEDTGIKADRIDHAGKLAKGCPVLAGGASVEVAETFNAMSFGHVPFLGRCRFSVAPLSMPARAGRSARRSR